MLPTWVGVVMAVSLAIIALAALTVGVATAGVALGMRKALRRLGEIAGPALEDARQLVGTIRAEVEGLASTSADVRARVVKAADAAEARLADVAATIRTVRRGASMLDWGRRAVRRGRGKR